MKWLILTLLALGVIVVAGCTLSFPCPPSDMGAPGNLVPANYALAPLSPTLTWEYPSSVPSPYPYPVGSTDCTITGFQVYLFTDVIGSSPDLGGTVSGSTHSFTPGAPLAPTTLYFWQVRVLSSSGNGPWSGIRAFYTGPMCATSSLAAPTLGSPAGVIHTLRPIFYWNYPGSSCLPEGYRIDVSTSASFADTSLSGGTGNPRTSWTTAEDLEDCTLYYWRVAAINDITLGPFSPTQTFNTQVGTCLARLIIFIPKIRGYCRIGPGTLYDVLRTLSPGDRMPVAGWYVAADGPWYYLADGCYASGKTGDLEGDPELLPIMVPPPLPELDKHSRSSCRGITSSLVCEQTPGCVYDFDSKVCRAQ